MSEKNREAAPKKFTCKGYFIPLHPNPVPYPHFCLLFNAYTRLFFSIYLLVLIFEKSSQRHRRN